MPGEGARSLELPARAPEVGSEDREVPLHRLRTATTASTRWRGAGARGVLTRVHAGTWPVSQLSCLRTVPSRARNPRRAGRGPSVFAPASDSRLWSKRVKNRALSRTAQGAGRSPVASNKRNRGSGTRAAGWTNLSGCNPGAHSLRLLVFIRCTGALTSPRPGCWPRAHTQIGRAHV